MFAAHLAAGLAIGASRPKVSCWAILVGAFLPDLLWIALAGGGLEPPGDRFFDGWSHSFASVLAESFLFALCFYRWGRGAMTAVGLATLSHLPLDALIHPSPLELWPHAPLVLGYPDWEWGQAKFALDKSRYWWAQLTIIALLLAFYWRRSAETLPVNLVGASCGLILGLHLFV